MSITTLTVHTHTGKRSYETYAELSDSHSCHKRNRGCDSRHEENERIPTGEFAMPLVPDHTHRKKVTNLVNKVVSPPSVERTSTLSYKVPPLSHRVSSSRPDHDLSSQKEPVSESHKETASDSEDVSEITSRPPARQSALQKMGIASFASPQPLSDDELHVVICRLFIEMAKKIHSNHPQALLYPKLALKLNPKHDEVKAQLLMTLGNAHFKKAEGTVTNLDSINAAINSYKDGCGLKNITNSQKALFSLNLGKAYLMRKYSADTDKAIACFDEGLKLVDKDFKLMAELHQGKSNAFMHKHRHSLSSSSSSSSKD